MFGCADAIADAVRKIFLVHEVLLFFATFNYDFMRFPRFRRRWNGWQTIPILNLFRCVLPFLSCKCLLIVKDLINFSSLRLIDEFMPDFFLMALQEDSELCNSNDASGVNLAQARQLENAGVPLLLATNSNPVEDLVALGFTRMQVNMLCCSAKFEWAIIVEVSVEACSRMTAIFSYLHLALGRWRRRCGERRAA